MISSLQRFTIAITVCCVWLAADSLRAQQFRPAPNAHYPNHALMPPGQVGSQMLLRGGPVPGYFQPTQIRCPQGGSIAIATNGTFAGGTPSVLNAGLLIGSPYRLKITEIPGLPGVELYPTVELLDRLHPPVGLEIRFPIPIHLTSQELRMAAEGLFVTRVIYLEDPTNPVVIQDQANRQRFLDVRFNEDPLRVADQLGRPMAILRIGSKQPRMDRQTERFMFSSPPVRSIMPLQQSSIPADKLERAIISTPSIGRLR
ncbi:MAG: hypothetical protein VW875_12770 [Planctomycetaceae bacterium]